MSPAGGDDLATELPALEQRLERDRITREGWIVFAFAAFASVFGVAFALRSLDGSDGDGSSSAAAAPAVASVGLSEFAIAPTTIDVFSRSPSTCPRSWSCAGTDCARGWHEATRVDDVRRRPEIEPDKFVEAWTHNGQVRGPTIKVAAGDKVRVALRNELPKSRGARKG